jgi:hypothetical protein
MLQDPRAPKNTFMSRKPSLIMKSDRDEPEMSALYSEAFLPARP